MGRKGGSPEARERSSLKLFDFQSSDPALRYVVGLRCVRQLNKKWKRSTGALAVGFGLRERKGRLNKSDWCATFYVKKKLKNPVPGQAIPELISLRVMVQGTLYRVKIATDVVVLPPPKIHAALAACIHNAHDQARYGSATALVQDADSDQSFLLTAGHVAARNLTLDQAKLGDIICDRNGQRVGTLEWCPNMSDALDIALVRLDDPGSAKTLIPRKNGLCVTSIASEELIGHGDPKNFRLLSWLKERNMTFQGWITDFQVDFYAVKAVCFPRLIHFRGAVTPGDSGALIVDGNNQAVGMHIMGTDASNIPDTYISLALPMQTVTSKLFNGKGCRLIR